eukprot:scaffold14901_cov102-Isochrysis_galbana.AAC.3
MVGPARHRSERRQALHNRGHRLFCASAEAELPAQPIAPCVGRAGRRDDCRVPAARCDPDTWLPQR